MTRVPETIVYHFAVRDTAEQMLAKKEFPPQSDLDYVSIELTNSAEVPEARAGENFVPRVGVAVWLDVTNDQIPVGSGFYHDDHVIVWHAPSGWVKEHLIDIKPLIGGSSW